MKPAAKHGDKVIGVDTHILLVPSPCGPVPTPTPMLFSGALSAELSRDVFVENMAAATVGSKALNSPPHVAVGGPFQKPPKNEATIERGTAKVLINDKEAARLGDTALTCGDGADEPNGTVIASGAVFFGD